MSELNPALSVSSCLTFFSHRLCISLSICLFLCLSFWPFVSEQLWGCAYIMCNPDGQWGWYKQRDGEKKLFLPLPLTINYYSLCPFLFLSFFFFCSLLYRCAAASSPTAMVTCIQKWGKEKDTWVRTRIWTTEAVRIQWQRQIWGRRIQRRIIEWWEKDTQDRMRTEDSKE